MTADLFERLSGGRLVDLGSRLNATQIMQMADDMKKTCPQCKGECVVGIAGVIDPATGLIAIMPVPCDLCHAEGEVFYQAHN